MSEELKLIIPNSAPPNFAPRLQQRIHQVHYPDGILRKRNI